MILQALAALAVLAGADATQTPSGANAAATDAAPAKAPNAKDPDKVVCRTEAITGSRFLQRVCHTQAEWDEMHREAELMQRESNQRPANSATTGGGFGG
jgi:hypothetical protein